MALPKKNRLKGKREFSQVFSETRPSTAEHFSLRVISDASDTRQRLAVVVPAKIAPLASARNLLRRRTLEAVSRIIRESSMLSGIRVVVSVRTPRIPEATALESELLSLMKKSGIVKDTTL